MFELATPTPDFDRNVRGRGMALGTSKPESSTPWILSRADSLAAHSQDLLLLLGRVLLGWIFVQSGWRKLMDIPGFVTTLPRRGLPDVLGYIAPPVEFIGGVLILLGLATRYTALLILLFTIIATFSSHRYWDFTDAAQRQQQHTHFWKNVSMMGGQVLLFVIGAGRYSLDRLLMRDRR
jgi:putative oxidoreductase